MQPSLEVVSESFLRTHAERLPASATVTVVHGFHPITGNRPVLKSSLPRRAYRKLVRWLSGTTLFEEATDAYAGLLRETGAAVVLAEYGPTGVHVLDACLQSRVPLVVHFHGYDASETKVLDQHAAGYRRLFREAAAIVVVSRPMREALIGLGAPPEKIHLNPCGVDCRLFDGSDPANSRPILIAVGRFVEKKAPHLTVAAFAEARRLCPGAELRMVGDGPLLDRCRALVRDLGLTDAVTFLGAQPPDVIRGELRRARAFVQHSVRSTSGDCEGMPVGILEAGASGLPVISTLHAGIPEAVLDGETGLLVEEGDVRGMAAAQGRVLRDPALAGSMGRAARRWISANFDVVDRMNRLWSILLIGVAGQGGRSGTVQGNRHQHGARVFEGDRR